MESNDHAETTRAILLKLLIQSKANVRRTGRDEGVEALAASIEAHGLLQNLTIRPIGKKFEVIAGQRRLLALQSLAEAGKLPADHTVSCNVLGADADATEISLAENEMRVAMHPADQFDAFKALADSGLSNEDIAARFGVAPSVVTRRLKLAGVAPAILESYRAGNIGLDAVMAFTLSSDQKQQAKLYKRLHSDENVSAWRIKRELTSDMVSASNDKMARFVGLEAYQAAGGRIILDMFSEREEGYLADADLLARLYKEKVAEAVAAVEAEGFAWVEYWEESQYDRDFDSIRAADPTKTEDEDEDDFDDEDDVDDEDLETSDVDFTDEEKAKSGAIVRVLYSGKLEVRRGLVERKRGGKQQDQNAGPAPEFSGPMTITLTTHQTGAIRKSLVEQPNIALRALAHALAGKLLMDGYSWELKSCLTIDPRHIELEAFSPEECRAHAELQAVVDGWKERLPKDLSDLWGWIIQQDDQTISDLLVVTTALMVSGVSARADTTGTGYLVGALGLNMADWWAPSLDGFISRMTKAEMTRAVGEVGMADEAARIKGLKKAEAAAATARALDGMRWLPKSLKS